MNRKSKRKRNPCESITVPFGANPVDQPNEKTAIRGWAEPMVWTDRMLDALSQGVKGGKWHALIDKVFSKPNLFAAARKVLRKRGAAGVDRQTVEDFAESNQQELDRLAEQLRQGTFVASAVRRTWIDKPGSSEKRPLGIPTIRDRVVQTAVVNVIEPIFDNTFHDRSFGFRRGRSCHDALKVVEEKLNADYVYVVDADLKSYFDTIPKDHLMDLVRSQISDRRMLHLIEQFLDQGIMEKLKSWTPEAGVPQGSVLSPLLANLYLNALDHEMASQGYEMVRYADDFVILCRSESEASVALEKVSDWVSSHGLTLHPEKTHIVDSREKSFSFLGYSFRGRFRFPRKKSHQKFVARLIELTPRKSGLSLFRIISKLNSVIRGWFGYFRHCFWNIFADYDRLIRRRLLRLQLKRNRLNRRRQTRHQRWPIKFFTDAGLSLLRELHIGHVQSLSGHN
jgi:RNA-directed DNA polymerase